MKAGRLTNAIRKSIVERAVKDSFADSLLECWKTVEAQFTDLVKDCFKDFDWEHVEPYRGYIHWHEEIYLNRYPGEWSIHWDDFRGVCGLPSINHIDISFKYPSKSSSADFLNDGYQKQAEDILRSYMVKYFTARKYYEDIQQILLGITTYKQLEDIVPELAKYLPKTSSEAVTALIPIEQVNRVRNLLQKETA